MTFSILSHKSLSYQIFASRNSDIISSSYYIIHNNYYTCLTHITVDSSPHLHHSILPFRGSIHSATIGLMQSLGWKRIAVINYAVDTQVLWTQHVPSKNIYKSSNCMASKLLLRLSHNLKLLIFFVLPNLMDLNGQITLGFHQHQ